MRIAVPAVLTLALACGLAPFASAQSAPAAPAAAPAASAPAAPSGAPVAVAAPSEKALRYHRSGNVLWGIDTLWGLLVPALLLFTGLSARLRDAARRIGRNWLGTVAVYAVFFAVVTFVLDLPLGWYAGFVRQHAYGLSSQTA